MQTNAKCLNGFPFYLNGTNYGSVDLIVNMSADKAAADIPVVLNNKASCEMTYLLLIYWCTIGQVWKSGKTGYCIIIGHFTL